LGSYTAMLLAFAGAPIGMLIGALISPTDPQLFGLINVMHYLTVYMLFVIPSMLTFSAIIFSVAVLSKRIIYTYITAFGLWVIYAVGSEIDFIKPLFDPFMFQTFEEKTKYWTAIERNTQLMKFEGDILINRFIWLSVSAIIFTLAYRLFSFQTLQKKTMQKKISLSKPVDESHIQSFTGLNSTPARTGNSIYKQFVFSTGFEIRAVFTSWPFIILTLLSCLLLFFKLLESDMMYGLNAYPITRLMILDIEEILSMALVGILIFYGAEIVWRERNHRFNEILDATPNPNWIFVMSKIIALCFIMATIVAFGIAIAVSIQVFQGYKDFEMSLYLERGFFYFIMPYLFLSVMTVFLQVVAKSRTIGFGLFVLYLIYVVASLKFGFEHPLFRFALGGIAAPLTDMNGSGRFLTAGYWMIIYWAAIAGLLVVLSYLLWNRGTLQPLRLRLRALRDLRTGRIAVPTIALLVMLSGSASYIIYNTNIINKYRTADDIEQISLAYEQQYRQFENLPMPRITDVNLDVDIYPKLRRVEARVSHILQNKTDQEIKTIHVIFPIDTQIPWVELQGAEQASVNVDLGYYIFDLPTPMQPSEKRQLKFESIIQHQGFLHARNDVRLVRNGSVIRNNQLTPTIGFNTGLLIRNKNTRREYGLPPLSRLPKLSDTNNRGNNYVRQDSDFINFETTVSTVASQTAISPGYLVKQWVDGDRRYFNYKSKSPIMNFYSYLSAEYQVRRDKWQDIDIELFYHAPHTHNIERMVAGVKDSLSYYSKAFSPYQFKQLRILEFPAYRNFARAYPGTIAYSEGLGFIADVSDPDDIDMPYYVTAHEVAHQWWAHQVMAANVQGGTMLVETLAQYSALLVMEKKYGKHQVRKFLKFELDSYLSGRAKDSVGERPLFKVENQPYIHYRKGALVMYALKDYIGEDAVNRALRKLVENHAFKSVPYAISTDLIGYIKDEASSKYHNLIEDLFKKITLFDLKLINATVTRINDGLFEVSVEVEAAQYYQDEVGNQEQVAINIPVDIGLFFKSPADSGYDQNDVIKMEKYSITESRKTFSFIVDRKPTVVGIDPYHKLIDRNTEDNLFIIE